jgi:molybdate transport system regulatory protein
MTRTQVCQLLGVAPKSLYLWERDGKVPAPKRDRRGWRHYSEGDVKALRSFLGTGTEFERETGARRGRRALEGLSARNQLRGTIVAVRGEGLLCEVVLRLGDGQEITAVITRRSAGQLGLRRGQPAVAVIKSTEVMLFR